MALHLFHTMGTTGSIRFPDATPEPHVLTDLESAFAQREQRFSLYRPESEISRIARGELPLTAADDEFRSCYARALEWRSRTNDAFTPHRPDGTIDLSGLVKAEAMAAGGHVLDAAGSDHWLMNVGGDLLARGRFGNVAWNAGIVDPDDRSRLLCTTSLEEPLPAMATSGTAERGEHVWRSDRHSGYRQVTVLAPDIVTADVLATAILAGGGKTRDEMLDLFGDAVDVLTVNSDGNLAATPRLTRIAGFSGGV